MNSFAFELNEITFDIAYEPGEVGRYHGDPDSRYPGHAPEIDYACSSMTVDGQTVALTWQLWELLSRHTQDRIKAAMYRDETKRDSDAYELEREH